ncbi:MFS transporter [Paenibacillus sp. ACRRY]|uniref:MFS transporter n=1 Tax=Paenibacillus sp. ACRRY TaxID=2918208 RepID=UPI001EF3F2CD|nr:MFS transporter [Paenibacillus sp. ACRRY]MCG7384500.1 MFS transporter [Paenibacillus sp. ACRRY]
MLLIIVFIAYISLGLPDSLFGSAWPAIYTEFGLQVSLAGFVTFAISVCTIISSLFAAKVIEKLGTSKVTAISVTMTAVALFGFSISPNLLWLCIFAIPLGLGAGSVDSALNNYVALNYKAVHMNLLHCFYGVGVSLSPYLMSLALSGHNNWREGYRVVFYIQGIIALITIITLPVWKRVKHNHNDANTDNFKTVSIANLAKLPAARTVWLFFISSCAIEFTVGIWGSTFLVKSEGLAAQDAAKIITFYYIGMALGRLMSGILANRLSSWKLIHIGVSIVLVALVLLLSPFGSIVSVIALFLIGFGNGPVFPNLIHLTPINFGRELSHSMMGTQMAAAYIGITFVPPIFGILAQHLGTSTFPFFILLLFLIMIFSMYRLKGILCRQTVRGTKHESLS